MATAIAPHVGKLHFDEARNQWKLKATETVEADQGNAPDELQQWFDFLSDALVAMLAFWGVTGSGGATSSKAPLGNLHALATWILATFPSGDVPLAP